MQAMITATTVTGKTALFLGAENGRSDVVLRLLEVMTMAGVPQTVNAICETTGATALSIATSKGYTSTLQHLCNYTPHVDLDLPLHSGETPVFLACAANNLNKLKVLLDAKADPNRSRHPPSHQHQHQHQHDNEFVDFEMTPLWSAVYHDQLDCVRMLVNADALPDQNPDRKWNGYTEGMIAALAGDFDTLNVLFKGRHPPSQTATNRDGETIEYILQTVHQLTLEEAFDADIYTQDVLPADLRDKRAFAKLAKRTYDMCDVNGDGVMDYDEYREFFVEFGLKRAYGPKFQDLLQLHFMRMDVNGQSVIEKRFEKL